MKDLDSVKKIAFEIFVALENATYQAFINSSQDMMDAGDFYDLDSLTPGNTRLRKDRIYLKNINNKLHFSAIAPLDSTPIIEYSTNIDFPEHHWSRSQQEKTSLKHAIMEIATNAGYDLSDLHKDPFVGYLNDLRTRLPAEDYDENLFTTIYNNAFRTERNSQSGYHSRIELSYTRNTRSSTSITTPLQLWIDKDEVAKHLNGFYRTNYYLVDVCRCDYHAEYLLEQSKLPYAQLHSNDTQQNYQDGYIVSYNLDEWTASKQYSDMRLDLAVRTITFGSDHNQFVPLYRFLLDLLKIILSMHVIPVITVLAIVSLVTTGSAIYGLVAGALYGAVVLAKPCYHRFFGESSQSRIMHQQRDFFQPININELFQNHFSGEQYATQPMLTA